MQNSKLFDDNEHLELNQLFRPGQVSVLQLHDLDERDQQIMVSTLLRRANQARIDTIRGKADPKSESYLDYPVFCLIEEAHNFAPANADAVSTDVLKQILSEGRKFGVSIGLISQRPGKLDGDVLSQCMTQCIMRIINPIDQRTHRLQSVESVGRDLLRELPSLSKGQVIVSRGSGEHPGHGPGPDPVEPPWWRNDRCPRRMAGVLRRLVDGPNTKTPRRVAGESRRNHLLFRRLPGMSNDFPPQGEQADAWPIAWAPTPPPSSPSSTTCCAALVRP